ncbi:MAG: sporulation protein YunB [Oscillospiraceae bacterium]|nr:sporulation protein YunB [Oscillospiraceae bacterium]
MVRRPFFRRRVGPGPEKRTKKRRRRAPLLLLLLGFGAFLVASALYLKRISGQIAVSDACDIMTTQVNAAITQVLQEGDYDADWFVSFEKNEAGEVTAISSNMTHINALSALLLDRVIGLTGNRNLTVSIPAGNLTGLSLLMGRGPGIPVEIMVLTSSHVEFRNNIVTAGINQTKHQISLLVIVDIDVLVPWGTESAQICTELLIADTVVVGQVPETYLNFDPNEG